MGVRLPCSLRRLPDGRGLPKQTDFCCCALTAGAEAAVKLAEHGALSSLLLLAALASH